jgi:hypothetical protein
MILKPTGQVYDLKITSHGIAKRAVLFPAMRFLALSKICGICSNRKGTLAAPENLDVSESHCS